MASSDSDPTAARTARPRIGITTYAEPARWGVWERTAVLLPHSYVEAVHRAGGVPVLLPPLPDGAAEALGAVDALVVAGGSDVDPASYGAEPQEGTDPPRRERDAWETALIGAALAAGTPVLGVCRGTQVLNVALGGTLHQHLPDVVGNDQHRRAVAQHGSVRVAVAPGSRLAGVLGDEADVPCYHHQAIDRLGAGLSATAWAGDGTVEAVELSSSPDVLGVQWHPELDLADSRLFAWLVAVATARRDARAAGARRDARAAGTTVADRTGGPA